MTDRQPGDPESLARAKTLVRIAGEALPPDLAHLARGPMAAALASAVDFARNAVSPATRKIYDDDWQAFRAWCDAHHAPALPAPPAIVAAYLAARAETLGRSGLRVVLAAIAFQHRRAGHAWSPRDPIVASVMRGILRAQRRPPRPAAALTSTEIRRLLAGCDPADLAGLRDRALLLTGFAGALRRSELVALDVADVEPTAAGMTLHIRHSKTDQEGQGASIPIAHGRRPETCPVRAMQAWLRRAGNSYGPVFRSVTAHGRLGDRLTGNGVWKILRRRAASAGLAAPAGERLSPHGLRAGFITEAYLHGALDEQVAHHARQTDVATTRRYRRRSKTLAASPTKLLDL